MQIPNEKGWVIRSTCERIWFLPYTAVPTCILLEDEVEVKRHVGMLSPTALQNFVGFVPQDDAEESSEIA